MAVVVFGVVEAVVSVVIVITCRVKEALLVLEVGMIAANLTLSLNF